MVAIKLYQPEELILNYFKSWGYKSPDILARMTDSFLKTHKDQLSMEEIWVALDEAAYQASQQIFGKTALSKASQTAYLKMLFLSVELPEINLFKHLSHEDVKKVQQAFAVNLYQVAPTLAESPMIPQKIKIYKPLLPVKKWYKHAVKKVKSYVQK